MSRELARRGHDVLHLHAAGYVTGKGAVRTVPGDPPTFAVEAVGTSRPFEKYSKLRRPIDEWQYARALTPRVLAFDPEVVISSNTPLMTQEVLQRACLKAGIRFVFWQQDIYGIAVKRTAEDVMPFAGSRARRLIRPARAPDAEPERRRSSASPRTSGPSSPRGASPRTKVHVIENWAPLDELPLEPRDNEWSRAHGLADKRVLLYAGTLGLKHNPELLLRLAARFRDSPTCGSWSCRRASAPTGWPSAHADGPRQPDAAPVPAV